jgi:hypothetical protein
MAYTTINKPEDYFNTKLYTGNGSDGVAITGVGFQPDWVWIKNRDTINWHILADSVRGGNKVLYTNRTDDERDDQTWYVQTFDSDGFTVGIAGDTNGNGNDLVAWNWLAGGTASSNTDGDITSSVSANTTSGFSIVSYTGSGTGGDTIGHGLGVTPKVVIAKARSDAGTWSVYHEGIGNAANGVSLENASGTRSEPAYWNSTAPTSSVFSVGTSNDTNGSSRTYIAYCFAEKKGFSKFGTYTGNGVASGGGPFIYLGFKPAFFLLKEISGSDNWTLMDNRRLGYNKRNDHLFPNLDNVEYATDRIDMVSNGIKIIDNDGSINQSGSTYIYMAFAEHPFVSSTGTPTTAR